MDLITPNSDGSRIVHTQALNIQFKQKVLFTRNLFDTENTSLLEVLPDRSKVLCLVDEGVLNTNPALSEKIKHYLFQNHLQGLGKVVYSIPGGEVVKNDLDFLKQMIQLIEQNQMCRHSYLIAIGGGAVLDAVGFAAAITHRGIRHIRIPTTVLSQNDSGMGVKNGVNYFGQKNFLGAFAPPDGVLVDFDFLNTLDDRNYRSGISEAFKVAILKDKQFLDWLCENAFFAAQRDFPTMEQLVHRCAMLHLNHIASGGDPFEKQSSRPLDFGHWSAHYLEEVSANELNHGEAVSIGVCLDLIIANLLNLITQSDAEQVITALKHCGLPSWHDALLLEDNGKPKLIQALDAFRQHIGGELTLVMPAGFGQTTEMNELPEELLVQALKRLKSCAG